MKAAAAAGTIFMASTMSTRSIEDIVGAAGNGGVWFQLYVYRDRGATQALVERAEAALHDLLDRVLRHQVPDFRGDAARRTAGKKLMLITNSEWAYAKAMMDYAFDRFLPGDMTWKDLFDLIIVAARKPSFFFHRNPVFLVTNEQGLLRPATGMAATGAHLGGNARMVGADGERGLMQIMPSVWSDTTRHLYGKSQSFDAAFDPRNNLRVGEAHLGVLQQWLYTHRAEWKSDPRHLLLAAWNGGRKRLLKAGFEMKRLPQSVQSYADRVSAIHDARMGEELTAWFNAQLARQGEGDPVLTEIVPKAEEPGGE